MSRRVEPPLPASDSTTLPMTSATAMTLRDLAFDMAAAIGAVPLSAASVPAAQYVTSVPTRAVAEC